MTDQNQKPNQKSILESLGARGQNVPDQIQDEILTQAMCEASLEERIQNGLLEGNLTELPTPKPPIQPPQTPTTTETPLTPELNVTVSPETMTGEIPASSIDPQPAIPNSTPVSPEVPPQKSKAEIIERVEQIKDDAASKIGYGNECGPFNDSNLRRLKEYIAGPEYEINRVMYQLSSLCSIPQVIPSMTLWDIQKGVDFPKLVFELVKTPGFIDNVWPYLKLLLGASKDNTVWAASVLTTIATFEAIKVLPFTTGHNENI